MNFLHLKYTVEVARTASITKAADNLYMSQPNLSRALKELEDELGISIFKRTSKGVVPTDDGEYFLVYARRIIDQVTEMESLFKYKYKEGQHFLISVPRASYISWAFRETVRSLDFSRPINIDYKETNSLRAITNILQKNYNLGIIRFQQSQEAYFLRLLEEKQLEYERVWDFDDVLLMSRDHPLAAKDVITAGDLVPYVQIIHGDPYVPSIPLPELKKMEFTENAERRIQVYERGSQFELLSGVPDTYMRVSPVPATVADRYGLVQRSYSGTDHSYKDILIYPHRYRFSEIDMMFISELRAAREMVKKIVLR